MNDLPEVDSELKQKAEILKKPLKGTSISEEDIYIQTQEANKLINDTLKEINLYDKSRKMKNTKENKLICTLSRIMNGEAIFISQYLNVFVFPISLLPLNSQPGQIFEFAITHNIAKEKVREKEISNIENSISSIIS